MSEINRLTGDPKENIKLLRNLTSLAYADEPIMADLCLAQGILESRLLGVPSSLAMKYNNLFGIKGKGTDGSINLKTWEVIKGKSIQVIAPFAQNLSLYDSILQHKKVLSLPRYALVHKAKTFNEAAKAILVAGYATDPNYTKSLIDVYLNHIKHD